MKQLLLFGLMSGLLYFGRAQEIPSRWDELTYSDWELALEKSNYPIKSSSWLNKKTIGSIPVLKLYQKACKPVLSGSPPEIAAAA